MKAVEADTVALSSPTSTLDRRCHPGPSLVIVKSGTATFYMADDPTCSPQVVQAGTGYVVSIVPAGFGRRIDEPAPANCPNLPNG